ncbi:hypothetical protein GIB67_037892 [Kingdonia uniflora]|uniref:Dof zinc finger protein n=1 Tax=Kingdonia uniflora TaxID=39325 RepID=A0A7J7LHD1_9MAGN|nr:hypothetical protein GIB67_037892 [Kingdonia uniflora]
MLSLQIDASSGNMEKQIQDQAQKCPRCDSSNTKFCYYNNYSLSQPRHFCKACKRYWTRGGTLRNIPVGGGCRKNKRIKKPSGSSNIPTSSLPSSTARMSISSINPLFYGLPDKMSGISPTFSRFYLPSSFNGYDVQPQFNSIGLDFSLNNQSQDFITSNSVLSNLSILGSSSSMTMASLLASSLKQQTFQSSVLESDDQIIGMIKEVKNEDGGNEGLGVPREIGLFDWPVYWNDTAASGKIHCSHRIGGRLCKRLRIRDWLFCEKHCFKKTETGEDLGFGETKRGIYEEICGSDDEGNQSLKVKMRRLKEIYGSEDGGILGLEAKKREFDEICGSDGILTCQMKISLNHVHYVVEFAIVKIACHFDEEQMKEKKVEAKIKGSSLEDTHITKSVCAIDEYVYCNFCKTSIFDYHRSCSNCSYDLCIRCCQEIRKGCLKGGTEEVNVKYIKRRSTCLQQNLRPLTDECSNDDIMPISEWKANDNEKISCPPTKMGGCSGAECSCFKSTGEIDLDNNNLSKAACREGSSDNYLYCPRMAVDCLDWCEVSFIFILLKNFCIVGGSGFVVALKGDFKFYWSDITEYSDSNNNDGTTDLDNFEEEEDSDFDSSEEEVLSDGEEVGDESVTDSDTSEESCIKEKMVIEMLMKRKLIKNNMWILKLGISC